MWSTLLYSTLTCPNARALQRHIVYTPRRTFSPQRAGYLYLLDPSRHTAHSSFLSFNHCFPNKTKISNSEKNKTRERDVCSVFSRGFSPDTHPSHSSSLYVTTSFCFFTVKHIHTYTCECTCTHTIDRPIVPRLLLMIPASSNFEAQAGDKQQSKEEEAGELFVLLWARQSAAPRQRECVCVCEVNRFRGVV